MNAYQRDRPDYVDANRKASAGTNTTASSRIHSVTTAIIPTSTTHAVGCEKTARRNVVTTSSRLTPNSATPRIKARSVWISRTGNSGDSRLPSASIATPAQTTRTLLIR